MENLCSNKTIANFCVKFLHDELINSIKTESDPTVFENGMAIRVSWYLEIFYLYFSLREKTKPLLLFIQLYFLLDSYAIY